MRNIQPYLVLRDRVEWAYEMLLLKGHSREQAYEVFRRWESWWGRISHQD